MRRTAASMPRYTFVIFLPRWPTIRGVSIGTLLLDTAQQGCCGTAPRARAYMDVSVRRIGTAFQLQGTNGHDLTLPEVAKKKESWRDCC
jgi:hypothetical protein